MRIDTSRVLDACDGAIDPATVLGAVLWMEWTPNAHDLAGRLADGVRLVERSGAGE